jgi:mRNA interferase RelE/StbE
VYEVWIERKAERDLTQLPPPEFRRIISAIKALGLNPRPAGSRKLVGSKDDWRIRVGDYRVIYEIVDADMVVRVMRVRHRKEAYR